MMRAGEPGQNDPVWAQRFLRAALPLGIGFLIVWLVWLIFEVVSGDPPSIVSATFGLVNALMIITIGWYHRWELRRPR